jgi:hypothetical protein
MLPEGLFQQKAWLILAVLVLVMTWSMPVIAQATDAESHAGFAMFLAVGWAGLMVVAGFFLYRRSRGHSAVGGLVLVLALASLALVYRTPAMIFAPQFTSEDATVFFAQERALGLGAFLVPYHGYYHTIVRILAAAVSPVPTLFTPAFYTLAWLGVFSFVTGYIFFQYPDRRLAPVIALVPALVSHTGEVFLVMTYTSWIGGLLLTAVVLLPTPPWKTGKQLAFSVLLLVFALSGPIGLALAPIYLLRWLFDRNNFSFLYVVAVVLGSVVQLTALQPYYATQPPSTPLTGPNLLLCLEIAVVRVPWSLMAGYQPQESYWIIGLVLTAVLMGFVATEIRRDFRKQLFPLVCFLLAAIFVVSGVRRITPLDDLVPLLNGDRYFYIPKILFVWALIHLAATARNPRPYYLALLLCALGSTVEFTTSQKMVDNHWGHYAELIDEGQTVSMPVNPPGWTAVIEGRHDAPAQK